MFEIVDKVYILNRGQFIAYFLDSVLKSRAPPVKTFLTNFETESYYFVLNKHCVTLLLIPFPSYLILNSGLSFDPTHASSEKREVQKYNFIWVSNLMIPRTGCRPPWAGRRRRWASRTPGPGPPRTGRAGGSTSPPGTRTPGTRTRPGWTPAPRRSGPARGGSPREGRTWSLKREGICVTIYTTITNMQQTIYGWFYKYGNISTL